jgi:hypothetical protein
MKEAAKYTGFIRELAWSIGLHYRVTDALIPSLFVEIHDFALGFSYDVNLSSLSNSSKYNGGMEVSLRWINPGRFYYKHPTKSAASFQ